MAIDKVKKYFKQYNIEDRILEFNKSSATVKEAAIAVGTSESRIAKTLSFKVEDKTILIVCTGDTKMIMLNIKMNLKKKLKC